MKTSHDIYFKDARDLGDINADSVDLMITSPPYPMIEMWDPVFSSLNAEIQEALQHEAGNTAFRLMHQELNKVWKEVSRVLQPGGIACVNIGDATRKIGDHFQLYPNHVAVTRFFQEHDFSVLPPILWRKQTNAPNKFMGSGVLPPNAYVTLEHEHILIFRKGTDPREFKPKSKQRYQSAYFWEERNTWFSDVWTDIKGASQVLNDSDLRERAAAFPVELPYRLMNMYSVFDDTVLDPFWGTGTTTLAAMASARNSIGYEIDPAFLNVFQNDVKEAKKVTNAMNARRIQKHIELVEKRKKQGKKPKYSASNYDFQVVTKQERDILFRTIKKINRNDTRFVVQHKKYDTDIEGDMSPAKQAKLS